MQNKDYEKGIINFLLPLIVYGISFYNLSWQVNLLLFISILLLVGKEYLFAVYASLAFYNVMYLNAAPFWASLVSSYLAIGIIILRIQIIKTKVSLYIFLPVIILALIFLNFIFKTIGEYYFLTGVKSSLQLSFILLVIISFILVPEKYLKASKEIFEKYLIPFLLTYLITGLFFFDFKDRFGAGSGAQCLALQLTIILCYLCNASSNQRNLQLLLLLTILLTGSRTYFILSSLIIAYDYFRLSASRMKLIMLANLLVVVILVLIILPYTGSRFDYTSTDFAGSLLGRFRNYYLSIDMIKQHPVTGNGMGSMLRVLEGWVNTEGIKYYQEKGDTTIMHNEYLRILVELGLLGFGLVLWGTLKVWQELKNAGAKYVVFIFLIASLLENTLALYTTGTLLFIILVAFSINSPSKQ